MAPVTTMTQLRRRDISRATILAAAVRQIAADGYDGVHLRDIASAAHVSIGLLQHRFHNREYLLAQALEHHCAELLAGWSALARAETDPWRRITSLVARVARAPDLAARAAVWAEFNAAASRREELRPPLRHIDAAWRGYLLDAIEAGTAHGVFAPALDAVTVAELVMALIDGALLAIAGGSGRMDGERMYDQVVRGAGALLHHDAGPRPS